MTGRWMLPVKVLLLAWLVSSAACPAVAQEKLPVRMRLQPLSTRGRSGGAIPIRIKLEYNSPQIMEGDLVLEMYNTVVSSEDLSAEIRYEGIVLQGSDYIFNTVLPPVEHSYNKLFQIVAWFETESDRIPLTSDPKQVDPPAPHDLLSLSRFERSTLVCSCTGTSDARRASTTRAFLGSRLSLDNYNPPDGDNRPAVDGEVRASSQLPTGVQNFTATWSAVDLPEDPLQLCAFDLVLLADGALGILEQRQMDALIRWVNAGGSLCVLPDGKRLRGPHLQFLQTLFETPNDPSLALTLSDGELLIISEQSQPIVNRHFGLGRVTLLPSVRQLETKLTDQHLRQINAHLWKVRRDNPMLEPGGGWFRQTDVANLLMENGYSYRKTGDGFVVAGRRGRFTNFEVNDLSEAVSALNLSFRLEPQANSLNTAAETALLPRGIRMVPTWVIAALLIAYVIAIGPLDYLVLGFFKARKYTWLVFPVVTALFTWLTVSIAHSYLSSTDSGGRVTLIDLGTNGQPARQSSLQMHFYAAQTQVENERAEQFVVPAQVATISDWQRYQNAAPRPVNASMSYSGRFPQNFSTLQNVRQWEPQTVRTLSLTPAQTDLPSIDWNDASLVTTPEGRDRLADQLRSLSSNDTRVDAVVLHQGDVLPVLSGFLFSQNVRRTGEQWMRNGYYSRQSQEPNYDAILSQGLLSAASSASASTFFSIVSQVSPHGAATLEDLPLADPSDPTQWLLMVVVQEQGETTVFRKVIYTMQPGLIGVSS
ncbi:MAG: hypothetical protein NXI04_00275 [Planctomycetaceae bacterium]|nr:hypothetical protein [Planctomycetaceae bacterium]